jgi:hypothetical protein
MQGRSLAPNGRTSEEIMGEIIGAAIGTVIVQGIYGFAGYMIVETCGLPGVGVILGYLAYVVTAEARDAEPVRKGLLKDVKSIKDLLLEIRYPEWK